MTEEPNKRRTGMAFREFHLLEFHDSAIHLLITVCECCVSSLYQKKLVSDRNISTKHEENLLNASSRANSATGLLLFSLEVPMSLLKADQALQNLQKTSPIRNFTKNMRL